jgi:hypothetical protein
MVSWSQTNVNVIGSPVFSYSPNARAKVEGGRKKVGFIPGDPLFRCVKKLTMPCWNFAWRFIT